MRVLFIGSSQIRHIKEIFQSCGWSCDELTSHNGQLCGKLHNLSKILAANCVYCVYGMDVDKNRYLRIAKLLQKKVIVHWIGTDVLHIVEQYHAQPKQINSSCINLAGSPLLQEELQAIGIESTVIPIVPTGIQFTPLPMPERHEVLVYAPEAKEDFYGMSLVREMARRFSDVTFHIVANSGKNEKESLPNISYEGTLDASGMRDLYTRCSVLFRYPQHDGLSMMLLEALGLGRTVIYKYKFPFVETPCSDSAEDVAAAFQRVFEMPPQTNLAAIEFVNTEFSFEKQVDKYKRAGAL